jgi:hypothetical protein
MVLELDDMELDDTDLEKKAPCARSKRARMYMEFCLSIEQARMWYLCVRLWRRPITGPLQETLSSNLFMPKDLVWMHLLQPRVLGTRAGELGSQDVDTFRGLKGYVFRCFDLWTL